MAGRREVTGNGIKTAKECPKCGNPVVVAGRGKPRKYCSVECAASARSEKHKEWQIVYCLRPRVTIDQARRLRDILDGTIANMERDGSPDELLPICKIGKAGDVADRLHKLQSGNFLRLEVVGHQEGANLERRLHSRFTASGGTWRGDEWFDFDDDVASWLAAEAKPWDKSRHLHKACVCGKRLYRDDRYCSLRCARGALRPTMRLNLLSVDSRDTAKEERRGFVSAWRKCQTISQLCSMTGKSQKSCRAKMDALRADGVALPILGGEPFTGKCKTCGGAVFVNAKTGRAHKYCSLKCRDAGQRDSAPARSCIGCGKSFQPNNHDQRWCSRQCAGEHWKEGHRGGYNVKRYEGTCERCGRPFKSNKAGRKYCSRQCAGTWSCAQQKLAI